MKAIFEKSKKIQVEYSDKRTLLIGWYQKFVSAYYYMLLKNNAKIASLNCFTISIDDFCRIVSQGNISKLKKVSPFDKFAINSCIDLIHFLSLKFSKKLELSSHTSITNTKACDSQYVTYLKQSMDLFNSHNIDTPTSLTNDFYGEILKLNCISALHNYCMASVITDLNYLCWLLCENYYLGLDSSFDVVSYKELYDFKYMIEAFYTANISTLKYADFMNQYLSLVYTLKVNTLKFIFAEQKTLEIAHVMQIGTLQRIMQTTKDFSFSSFGNTIHKLFYLSKAEKSFDFISQLSTVDVHLLASFVEIFSYLFVDNQCHFSLLNKCVEFNQFFTAANKCGFFILNILINIQKHYDIDNVIVCELSFISQMLYALNNMKMLCTANSAILKLAEMQYSPANTCDAQTNVLIIAKMENSRIITANTDFINYIINTFYEAQFASKTSLNYINKLVELFDSINFTSSIKVHKLFLLDKFTKHYNIVDTTKYVSEVVKMVYKSKLIDKTKFITNIVDIQKLFNLHDSLKFITELININHRINTSNSLSIMDIGNYYDFIQTLFLSDNATLEVLAHIIAIDKRFNLDIVSDIDVQDSVVVEMLSRYVFDLEIDLLKLLNTQIKNSSIFNLTQKLNKLSMMSTKDFIQNSSALRLKYLNNAIINDYLTLLSSAELVYRHYINIVAMQSIKSGNDIDIFQTLNNSILFENPKFNFIFKSLLSLGNDVALNSICDIDMDLYIATLINGSCFNEDGLLNYHGFLLTDSVLLNDYILYA